MISEKALEIIASPKTYADWLDCFEVLCKRNVTRTELQLLREGTCTASAGSVEYLEKQLVKTINAMIKRYIHAFNKELEMRGMYNDYDNLYQLFVTLANRLSGCLFFTELDFMSVAFRDELRVSVVGETKRFWKMMTDSIYSQCIDLNSTTLEDELYMIKRIKLFN